MQNNRRNGNPFFDLGDPFAGFGGFGGRFGGQRPSMLSNFFGGRDPFDDPFFQNPFGGAFGPSMPSMFGSSMNGPSMFGHSVDPFNARPAPGFSERRMPQLNQSRGPIIEELSSDDEGEKEDNEEREKPRKHARSGNGPYVEDPDDVTEGRSRQIQHMNNFNRTNNLQSQPRTNSYSFQSSTVTYSGVDGAYYTSSKIRRTGSDGLTFEESKEADTTSSQASHRISRGLHDKGHTVDRKLNSDGKVDTMQMLHNLNEDELSGFDEAWTGNARKHLPGWNEGLNSNAGGQREASVGGGWALPSNQYSQLSGNTRFNINAPAGTSRSQKNAGMTTPDVTKTSRGRGGRSATTFNKDEKRKH